MAALNPLSAKFAEHRPATSSGPQFGLINIDEHVKELNREYRAEWAAQKERAREEQKERRESVLDDRRAQTAALVTALNAMTKVVERLEAKSAGE